MRACRQTEGHSSLAAFIPPEAVGDRLKECLLVPPSLLPPFYPAAAETKADPPQRFGRRLFFGDDLLNLPSYTFCLLYHISHTRNVPFFAL